VRGVDTLRLGLADMLAVCMSEKERPTSSVSQVWLSSARRGGEREAIRQLGRRRERRKVREGGGANDYMKGMGRQTDEGPGGKPKDQAMFPAWVGFGRSPLRGIPVSLNPKTPGWRAGMCVWLRQQAVLLVCLNRPASRPSGGRGQ
jgi:hypothetical protein